MVRPQRGAALPAEVTSLTAKTAARSFAHQVEALYRADGPRLWRSLLAYSHSRSVADDALAEAFAQLLRRGDEVRDPQKWIWRSAFRIAAGDLQRQRRASNAVFVDIAYDMPEDTADLIAALQTLSDMQRLAVVLHDYAGYRAAEVAHITGSTEAAVRIHLMRARRKLRPLLDPEP